MMKKLVNILLVLTMCVGLAVPAFAEPAEEVSVPEEVEVFQNEEPQDFPDPTEKEGPEETEEITEPEREAEVPKDEGNTYLYQKDTNTNSINAISSQSSSHEGVCIMKDMWCEETYYKKESDQHRLWGKFKVYCSLGCGANGYIDRPIEEWENHSWTKGSLVGYQSSATTHTATYNYSCSVCGKATTKPETESHSWGTSSYTGNNFHKGTLHYFVYDQTCAVCGYTGIKNVSYSCPGNSNGEGCISPILGAKPPIEVESTDPTEEVIEPGDVVEPEEVTEPEETVAPEETTEPEEVTEPEETEVPEEVEMPEETEAPEEPVTPEDPTGPGETVVPEDGESVE